MDATTILNLLHEFSLLLGVYVVSLTIAIWWGRQAVINIISALYLSLLLYTQFPYLSFLNDDAAQITKSLYNIGLFCVIGGLSLLVTNRIMPREYLEGKIESLPKKIILAGALAVLVILICYTVLPLNTFLTPQQTILALATNPQTEFWWLVLPLVIIALN